MKKIFGWTVAIGLLWFLSVVVLQILTIYIPDPDNKIADISRILKDSGASVGIFIAPTIQLMLVIMILLAAAEQLGFKVPQFGPISITNFGSMNNVQALIAIIIVSSVCIAALAGVREVNALKDLALVVVGFYFGSRRRPVDIDSQTDGVPVSPAPRPASPVTAPTTRRRRGGSTGSGESAEEQRAIFDAS